VKRSQRFSQTHQMVGSWTGTTCGELAPSSRTCQRTWYVSDPIRLHLPSLSKCQLCTQIRAGSTIVALPPSDNHPQCSAYSRAPPTGCPERIVDTFFSKESIIWLCLIYHQTVREREGLRMEQIRVEVGSDVEGRKMRRIGGWGGELRAWFDDVRCMLRQE
jgi:hypothetical protein